MSAKRARPASSPLYALHNPGAPCALRLAGLDLVGFSVSAVATYVLVPTYDLSFDLGHCPMEAVPLRHLLLSHTHQDHALGVYRHHSLRAMQTRGPSHVVVPAESREAMVAALRAFAALEGKPDEGFDAMVRGVRAGDEVALNPRRRVRVFDVVHRLPSRGYTVLERQRVLLPAWEGASGAEVGAAVQRGEVVHREVERARITYVGDSTIETLERNPEVGQSDVLLLEATHLPGTPRELSAKWGHTHLDELSELYRARPEALASAHIVLKHFSLRYEAGELRAALRALPEGLRERVTLLLAPRGG